MTELDVLSGINACVIIPTYNNAGTLAQVLDQTLLQTSHILIVNDGSTDNTQAVLANYPFIKSIHMPHNQGKGMALRTGFREARKLGYEHAIAIDSDGQHFPTDIPVFVAAAKDLGCVLLIGDRNMNQEGIPKKSSFGNRFSNFWFWFETGIRLTDTQSGYRLYPLKAMDGMRFFTRKFEFEIEVIVKAAWRGIPVTNVPIDVYYDPVNRVSHFRPFRDFARISLLNTWLVLVSLLYIRPRNFFRAFRQKGFKRFFFEDLLESKDSPLKKSLSVSLGVFIGLSPFWGLHTVLTLFLAVVLRLNKLIAYAFSNISLPPLIPFIVIGSLQIGGWVLGKPHMQHGELNSLADYRIFIQQHLAEYIVGSLLLAAIAAVSLGAIAYYLLRTKPKQNQ